MSAEGFQRASALVFPKSRIAPWLLSGIQALVAALLVAAPGVLLIVAEQGRRDTLERPADRLETVVGRVHGRLLRAEAPQGVDVTPAVQDQVQLLRNLGRRPVDGGPNRDELTWQARAAGWRQVFFAGLAGTIGLMALLVFLDRQRRRWISEAVGEACAAIRNQLHRQLYRLGQSALPSEGIGPVQDLFARDVEELQRGLHADENGTVRWAVFGVLCLLIALVSSTLLTVGLIVLATLGWAGSVYFRRTREARLETSGEEIRSFLRLCEEDLGQVRTVRVFGAEAADGERFTEHLDRLTAAEVRTLAWRGRPPAGASLAIAVAVAASLGLAGWMILERRVGVGTVLVVGAELAALAAAVRGSYLVGRAKRQAQAAAGRIYEFLDRRSELLQVTDAAFLSPLRKEISIEGVTILSPSGKALLDEVSLAIPAGSRIAIMGRDDDSKQALACLIPRLIDPKRGRVKIDGLDLREVTLESLRAQVGIVFLDDLVFSDTVAANIGLNDPRHDRARIVEAAKLTHSHHFIQHLPHGYDTYIGPVGHSLRPDEQFRIALARTYLSDPSILILEEPPGALDDSTRLYLEDAIDRLSRGRTVIFLPHRLSTIRTCQQVVVLHNGRIEAVGTPRELQQTSKLFRHLQYVEFNQFASGGIEAGQMTG